MVPSSITIKLDFGSGTEADSYSVSRDGGVPTPFSSGALSASAHGQSTEALPTPFSGADHSLGQAASAAPVPSLDLAPADSTVWAGSVPQHGDAPAPLTAGDFSAASADAPPTPMDNPDHIIGFDDGQAPEPDTAFSQDADDAGEQH
jgi:hypothetical protein